MASVLNRLTAKQVQNLSEPGRHADGGGLYLSTLSKGRSWVFVYRWDGKRKEMGFGSARTISLARARTLAAESRAHLAEGRNPADIRKAERAAAARADTEPMAQPAITFSAFADSYIASVESGWRNPKHRSQWRNTLTQHASALSNMPVAEISTDDVLSVLQPIWGTVPETASRVRGRIEKVLSAAKARGLRPADSINPAQWKGHLEVLLPRRQRLTRGHHAAMPYTDLPALWQTLGARAAVAARALEFLILTAARTGEALGATWDEVNGGLWTIPAERMKAGKTHTVVLPPAAVKILDEIGRGPPDAPIFSGRSDNSGLSNMALEMLMRRMKLGHFTVHGFRSTFKDWCLDCTEFPDEISEEALAHTIGNAVRRAYRRGEALDRRRALMVAWETFVTTPPVALEVAA